MSRGFVKEDDQEEVPLVPQRAFLPQGMTNFVTKTGLELLLTEKQLLISEKENLDSHHENERRIALNYINAKLQLLNDRISGARVVDPNEQPYSEIRFGAKVKLSNVVTGDIQTFQIVGVDEADVAKGKISFISPLARALINKKTGDKITSKKDRAEIIYEIINISWL